jgi:aminoglycoside 2'-N-acetyltransferase I
VRTTDEQGEARHVRRLRTADLTPAEIMAIRRVLWAAFEADGDEMTEDDWQHGLGGMHFLVEVGGEIVSHASVVERELHVGQRSFRTGYVEAVATAPDLQGRGLGTRLMEDVTSYVRETFELGALGTGRHRFYERLGWLTWRGRSFVRTPEGLRRTPDEDGFILVLPTPAAPDLDLTMSISCDLRPGDVW